MTTLDASLLLREIARSPGDDAPRLGFADYLDELGDVRVTCPKCTPNYPTRSGFGLGWLLAGSVSDGGYFHVPCVTCGGDPKSNGGIANGNNKGTGTVLGTSNRDRAEYIRTAIELFPYPNASDTPQPHHMTPTSRWLKLRAREAELLTRYRAEWLRMECQKCGGRGTYDKPAKDGGLIKFVKCDCFEGDTGGLLRKFTYSAFPGSEEFRLPEPVRVTEFRRGFPYKIEVPTIPDTPWLRAVMLAHPVQEVVCLDREPYHVFYEPRGSDKGDDFWRWWCYRNEAAAPVEHQRSLLPEPVYEILRLGQENLTTRDLAVTALARAVAEFGRNPSSS